MEQQSRRRVAPLPAEDRRAAIIAATLPLLEEHGATISTRQIAEAAGVAEGTLFRVFPDKASLIRAAVLAAHDVSDTIAALEAIAPDASIRERFSAIAETVGARVNQRVRLFGIARELMMSDGFSSDFAATMRENNRRITAAVIKVIKPHSEHLRLSPEDTAHLLLSLIITLRSRMLGEPSTLSPGEIVEVLLNGVLWPTADAD